MAADVAQGRPVFHAVGMHDLPAHDDWLTEPEADRLQRFRYTKRREESRLGRWTAKQTLARSLGLDDDDATLRALVIRNASDGAPEVFIDQRPAPISISMTDRADWAVCAVLVDGGSIGCDLEVVEPRSDLFVRDYFTERERAAVAAAGDDHDLVANLTWSAKESALKVLRTGLRRDTRSVEVRLDAAPVGESWAALSVASVEGGTFTGWWQRYGDFVLTFVSADRTEAPVPLVVPAPLADAAPSHRWLDDPRRA